jgi:hypothetical protein
MDSNKELVVYSVVTGQIAYIGEKVDYSESTGILKLTRVLLMNVIRTQTGEQKMLIDKVPYSSRDSHITIDTKQVPGVVITYPDPELIDNYNREIVSAYSTLKLV